MLEEKITKVFEEEYGTVLNIEPDFDEIFKPREISLLLEGHAYNERSTSNIFFLFKKIKNEVIIHKNINNGKKDFTDLFSLNFLSLELLKLSTKLTEEIWLKNYFSLAFSEYDTGHELIEQNKPFPDKFLNNSLENFRDYIKILNDKGKKDPYAFAHIGGSYLELAFSFYNKRELEPDTLNKIKLNIKEAIENIERTIEDGDDKTKLRNFQTYFARRLYNFNGLTKKYICLLDKAYYLSLSDSVCILYNKLGLKHPFDRKKLYSIQKEQIPLKGFA